MSTSKKQMTVEEHQSEATKAIVASIPLQFIGRGMTTGQPSNSAIAIGGGMMFIGAISFIYGCWHYARSKGYPGAFGLVGIFFFFGLLALAVLPNKNKKAQ